MQKRDRLIDIEPDWVHLDTDENGIRMNSYFVQHPETILGEMKMVSGRFGPEATCEPFENADLSELLNEAVSNIHGEISEYEVADELEEEDNSIPADPTVRNFSYTILDDKIYFRENSRMSPVEVSATAENRIKGMIGIRDCVRNLIELQTEDYPDSEIKQAQEKLNTLYDSFFSWLEDEDYILKSPVRRIHRVKTGTNIKETYSDEALELMRDNCTELRDLAIIDMLASTGMRVGEMVLLNRNDIDFNERECIVFGKGSKERVVYFDARTKIHLQNYLESRTDDNPALFVSLKSPHERLKIGGVEVRLREFGKQLGLQKVHPHKFRRTLATMAIDKGMPIEQLQQLLGHRKIDTTLQYAMVKQSNVKIAHRKYIG